MKYYLRVIKQSACHTSFRLRTAFLMNTMVNLFYINIFSPWLNDNFLGF